MVKQCAAALGEALVQSEQYKEYVLAKKEVDADLTASNLLEAYAEKEEQISQAMMKSPEESTNINELAATMQTLRLKITENDRLVRLSNAQKEFNSLMQAVNEIISHYIVPEGECESSGCDGNCAHCHGH